MPRKKEALDVIKNEKERKGVVSVKTLRAYLRILREESTLAQDKLELVAQIKNCESLKGNEFKLKAQEFVNKFN